MMKNRKYIFLFFALFFGGIFSRVTFASTSYLATECGLQNYQGVYTEQGTFNGWPYYQNDKNIYIYFDNTSAFWVWFESMPATPDVDYTEYSTSGIIGGDGATPFLGTWTWHGRDYASPPCVLSENTTTPAPTATPTTSSGSYYGTINVVKLVINDNGGTKKVSDFPLFVNGRLVVSGDTNSFSAPAGAYSVTETSDVNYKQTFSGDCGINGQIGLIPGDNKFCIVTNNDIIAPVVVPLIPPVLLPLLQPVLSILPIPSAPVTPATPVTPKTPITPVTSVTPVPPAPPVPPLIAMIKTANPLSLPAGPGSVEYTYALRNIGTVPVTDITVVGDTCKPIILVSGDTNNDKKLDVNEVWISRCTTNLIKTHTSTAVATGWANGISTTDIARATVVVGVPIVPPLIHVTKVPSVFALDVGGGVVTYTKTVTNPGLVALSNIRLTDDKCDPVSYISGDTNNDKKLDPTEKWVYTCQANITETTVNTVTANGDSNGLTARDIAIATVVVAVVPKLPDTGIAFMIPWRIILFVVFSIFAIVLFTISFKRKKRFH